MKPLLAFLALFVLASIPLPAMAQVDPVNMRSGFDSVVVAPATKQTVQIFTVPAGQRFVLTDFMTAYPLSAVAFKIVDNTNTIRWRMQETTAQLLFSLQTGLAFDAGHSVGVQVFAQGPSGGSLQFQWSGYLAPAATSSVPTNNSQELGFSLSPNPARQVVTLRFELAHSADVNLGIYDAQGRRVRTVTSGQLGAGIHVKTWDGTTEAGASAPSGVYFARLESSEANSVRRLVRIR